MFGLEKTAIYAIGAGVLALALIGAAFGLINYGQKLERCKAKNVRLDAEIVEASAWKDRQLHILAEKDAATARWQLAASNFEIAYNAALLDRPEGSHHPLARARRYRSGIHPPRELRHRGRGGMEATE